MGREGHCRQISRACVGSTSSVLATLGLPPFAACVLSLSTLLRLQVALQGWALSCMHFPGLSCSGSGFWVIHKAQTWLGLCLVPSLVRAAQATRSLTSALSPDAVHLIPSAVPASVSGHASQVILVSLLGSWFLAATLPVVVNHPESQGVFKPVCSLVGDAVSGLSFPLSPPRCLLPLAGDGSVRSRLALLWYSLSPLFWERVGSA